MHLYAFWRLSSVPWVAGPHPAAGIVACSRGVVGELPAGPYPGGKGAASSRGPAGVSRCKLDWRSIPVILCAAGHGRSHVGWLGLCPAFRRSLRGWAAGFALILSVIGTLWQGLRPPVLRDYEVQLAGLPQERDGLVLVALSDLHLGTLIGERWLKRLVDRVEELHPDLLLVVGDLVDGNIGNVESLLPHLKNLRAPLGIWAVTGNHEYYAGLDRSIALFEAAGFSVLRDRWAQITPGVVLAGVDDLTARQQFGQNDRPVEKALADRPAGATILLSHSPLQADKAAAAGVGLMLSGHTHNGQIWPFNHLVALRYPLMGGRYQVDGMTVIVSRGAGTWGPRMRLWWPSEIVRIKLKAMPAGRPSITTGSDVTRGRS